MLPQMKAAIAVNAASATNGETITGTQIDTKGFDFATIDVWATTQAASTQAGSPSSLKLQECDTTVVSSFVDIVGARGGSATATNVDFVVPIGVTAGINNYKFNVDCRARMRYLSVVAVPKTTQTFYGVANLGRAEQAPISASKAGVLALVEI